MRRKYAIKGVALALAVALSLSISAAAQEMRSEISVQGTGFFTKDSDGNGIRNGASETGGFLVGYRYNINPWLAAEGNYGYARNTQSFFVPFGAARIQADVHQITGSAVVKLPHIARVYPYVLGGGGVLVFDPTGNAGGAFPGATQTQGTFLYGAGADYPFTRHLSLRAEYRGFVYKTPSFNLSSLNTDSWTHVAQPSAGFVFRF
ncbi:MAG TPA: outer membrane beta-barrel protein [Terriglobales bacterium]|nr:outer membrane beta-barrel protein [Terriglobales bacterium]